MARQPTLRIGIAVVAAGVLALSIPVAGYLTAAHVFSRQAPSGAPSPTGPVAAPAAPAPPGNGSSVVMIIRHGEKPDGTHPGIDAVGQPDDSSMTQIGWERARRLVDIFDPAQGAPKVGLARPKTIFAAGANEDGAGLRTRQTVMPLSAKLGITVNSSFGKGDEQALIRAATSQPGPTLISWQHGEIPSIAETFPGVSPTPPSDWPDDRFDVVWTFTKTPTGWHFEQVPELALPQDQAAPISDQG